MIKNVNSYIMPVYGEPNLEFTHGEGAYLFSIDKKKYLDFGGGIAVNSLGHCHPSLIEALHHQSKLLWHTSNLYYSRTQEQYAELLCKNTFAEKVFFTNSGAEAIECGLKVIRSYNHYHQNSQKINVITFEGAFHGRTFAAMSAQMNKKYSDGFEPLLPGFIQAPFNDINKLEKIIDENSAAIMIETIQGEGGVRPVPLLFLEKIKNLCIKKNLILFLDEVQSGFGRSGKLFSYQWSNIEPDIMAVAKGIGSGFPMGACLTKKNASIGMIKGKHGSTFGGNPLAIAVGTAVIKKIISKGFLDQVDNVARYLWSELISLKNNIDEIQEVRGAGLLLGIKTKSENNKINKLFESNGLLALLAADNIIRFAPPLIITKKEVDIAIKIIKKHLVLSTYIK